MARGYWRQKGMASKTRVIGRVKGYHGVNYGGTSVGGIVGNRKLFGSLGDVDHLPTRCCLRTASPRACPSTVPNWPTRWRSWSACMTHRPSRP